jgi:ERCC4-type nuclease
MARTILIDDRVGSREFLPLLGSLNVPVKLERLEYGDFCFPGNGPKGEVQIGIERKTVDDLINSLASSRLSARQLPGMVQTYPYRWIIVEGLWRSTVDGRIEVFRPFSEKVKGSMKLMVGGWYQARTQLSWFQVRGLVTNLEVEGACWVESTSNADETARVIGVIFHWWGKDWKTHRGHLGLEKGLTPDRVLYTKPSYPRLVANVLPGIGWDKSKSVAKHFHTIERMVEAGPTEWARIPGVGKKLSTLLPLILRGTRGVDRAREE